MKYRVIQSTGDSVAVPQVVFQKLTAAAAKDDSRFRVALFLLNESECDTQEIATRLGLSLNSVQSAVDFWEGAGLLAPVGEHGNVPITPYSRKRLTTKEVLKTSEADKTPEFLISEIQRLFGGIVSQSDINIFITLYSIDKILPEVILMVASFCAERGKTSARYIEKMLLSWQRDGLCSYEAADAHLRLLTQREQREEAAAAVFGLPMAALSLTERKKVNAWAEEYSYDNEMIEAARLAAGEHSGEIKYVDKILSRWFAKGYKNPRDVQLAENNGNIRVQGAAVPSQNDILSNYDYVPLKAGEG